jgi:hypothetical protein
LNLITLPASLGIDICDNLKNLDYNITYKGDNLLTWLAKNGDHGLFGGWTLDLLSRVSPPNMAYKSTAPDTNGLTAFEIATQRGNKIVIDALLKGYTYDPTYDLNALNCGVSARNQEMDAHIAAYTAAQEASAAQAATAQAATAQAAAAAAAAAQAAAAQAEAAQAAQAEVPEAAQAQIPEAATASAPAAYAYELTPEEMEILRQSEEQLRFSEESSKEMLRQEEAARAHEDALELDRKMQTERNQAEANMYKGYEYTGHHPFQNTAEAPLQYNNTHWSAAPHNSHLYTESGGYRRLTKRKGNKKQMRATRRSVQRGGTMNRVEFKKAIFSAIRGKNNFKNHIDEHNDHVIHIAADAAYKLYTERD